MTVQSTATVYHWDDLTRDHPLALLSRRRIIGEKMMISEIALEPGCDVPSHHHANEQFCIVLKGCLRFGVGEPGTPDHRFVDVRAGEVLHLPPHVPHSAYAVEDTLVLDIFSPPSQTTGVDRG
ncbi:MAG: cupin domain-containing protein [Pirellulaceae bacterium]|nr:cupin domain-containing protein [Pirellulaceae bacterium]